MIQCWHAWHTSMRTQAQPSYIHGKGWHREAHSIFFSPSSEEEEMRVVAADCWPGSLTALAKPDSLKDPALKSLGGLCKKDI